MLRKLNAGCCWLFIIAWCMGMAGVIMLACAYGVPQRVFAATHGSF